LILASNRGPIEFYRENGTIKTRMGSGGLVSTLLPLMKNVKGTWVAASNNPVDIEVASKYPNHNVPIPEDNPKFYIPFLNFDEKVYDNYYNVISNSILWYIHHNIWKPPEDNKQSNIIYDAWKNGYVIVNKEFANKIVDLIDSTEKKNVVMLQDYHLYLSAHYIRNKVDDIFLSQFIHVPWPESDYLSILPTYIKDSILNGLLANDLVGFHIPKYVDNFLISCQGFADKVDYKNRLVHHNGHKTMVRSYPISVDIDSLNKMAKSPKVNRYENLVKEIKGNNFLIYRTDRADLSKNIIRGFQSFELFLDYHPEYQERVKFLVTGKATRENLEDYKNYRHDIVEIIDKINLKYSTEDWQPITEIFDAPYELVIAALKNYDCLMVNPICDGMNIVSKEGAVLNNKNGVLILSKEAGSYDELKNYVLKVDPYDVLGTAHAIFQAVNMDKKDRIYKMNGLNDIIQNNTLTDWISKQFKDIEDKF
jgi:trehalose 6-phosphate synthase